VVRADEVIPPLEGLGRRAAAALADRPFVPITVAGDRQFFVSLRYGRVLDRPRMLRLLTGAGVAAGASAADDARPACRAGRARRRRPRSIQWRVRRWMMSTPSAVGSQDV